MTERYRLALVREPSIYPIGEQILAPEGLAKLAGELLASEAQEIVLALHLDRRHNVRGHQEVARGGLDSAQVDMRVLFAGVLVAGTPALAIAHNHPSGDPTPSLDDIGLTRRVARAAELLGIEFVDHVVVASGGWTSLRQHGAL
jgi:DNA repair protein RadC